MKENKHKIRKLGWKFSYITEVWKPVSIDGCQRENLRLKGSNMVVSKGGFSWCMLLTEAERHLNSPKNVNSLETQPSSKHSHTHKRTQNIVIAEVIKTYYPTCSIIASSQ
jgi:hypothetical protein